MNYVKKPNISITSKYHIKYIGIIDDNMGILTRNIELTSSFQKNRKSRAKNDFMKIANPLLSVVKESTSGVPNPKRYDTPIVNSYISSLRLPVYKRTRRRERDFESLEKIRCKETRTGLQGSKITNKFLLSFERPRKTFVDRSCTTKESKRSKVYYNTT